MTNALTPEMAQKLIKIQEQELVLRTEELGLKKQMDKNSFEYSKECLRVKVEDEESDRKHKLESKKLTYLFSGIIFTIFIIFIAAALFMNKDEIVKEIIKALLYISTSGIGGYYLGKNKEHKEA